MIPYGKHNIDSDDIEAVTNVLKGEWLTGGPAVSYFENIVKDYLGVKHAIAVSNGTAALHLAALALGLKEGDVGVTSPLTFLASANAIAYCGARPDFVDIELGSLCISPEALEKYIHDKGVPKVVIPVDFAGVPANLPRIWEMSKQYGFKVIEDAAHSIGSDYFYDGKRYKCGSCAHSDIAIFSFHPVKTVTAGEGGMVLTNSDHLAKIVRLLSSHGMCRDHDDFVTWGIENSSGLLRTEDFFEKKLVSKAPWLYQQQMLGYNYRITDIQCALGSSQFKKIDTIKQKRRNIYEKYLQLITNKSFSFQKVPEWSDPAFHLFVMNIEGGDVSRYALLIKLREQNIFAQVHYIPVYLQPWYSLNYKYRSGMCLNAESVYQKTISLPLYPSLEESEILKVVKIINEL